MTAKLKKSRVWTPQRFLRHEGTLKGYELVDGTLRKKGMGAVSSSINSRCGYFVQDHVLKNNLGFCFDSECMYSCCPSKPEQIRKPDVSFIRFGRFPGDVLPEGIITIAPDFIIEVVSTNDRAQEIDIKIEEFREAKVPLIWVVYPATRSVAILRLGKAAEKAYEDDLISADPIVAGFEIKVSDLLPIKPPAPVSS